MRFKTVMLIGCLFVAALIAGQAGGGFSSEAAVPSQALRPVNIGEATPLYFVANEGQMNARALYYARTPGYNLWLTQEGLVFDRIENTTKSEASRSFSAMTFIGANRDIEIAAADPAEYKVSYFLGRDEADWKTGISTSKAVLYKNVYDGIDLRVYGTEKQVEYDWIIAPGADPAEIRFAYSGANAAKLSADGDLVIETSAGQILQRKPVSHQTIDGRRVDVASAFRAHPDGSFGFSLGAYNPRRALTIDPLVHAYSTYLGGHKDEYYTAVAVDSTDAIYLRGITYSGDFPPEMGSQSRKDTYVTKLSADGSSLIYTAFFPSTRFQHHMTALFVDAKGFVYLGGGTSSNDFPIKNAFQPAFGGGLCDGFILKLSKDGRSLVYSSYIGGNSDEFVMSVAADAAGAAYLGGSTHSRNFPMVKPFKRAFGGYGDGFAAKVAPDGTSLAFSTYLGGSSDDQCYDLALASDGGVVLVGNTASTNFPVKSAFQRSLGGGYGDGFIAKLAPAGNALVYSSYFGGSGFDSVRAVALDGSGAAYIVGHTQGKIAVKNAFQSERKGKNEGFAAKIAANGRSVVYSSYLGGAGDEMAYDVAVDGTGAAYIAGYTGSASFPVKNPFQAKRLGATDAILTIVDPGGAKLLFSTFLGGIYRETGFGIALGADGAVYVSGITNSPDLPMLREGAYQGALVGGDDAFVFKFTIDGAGRRK